MKTFELPVSDCGCFVAGMISDDTIRDMREQPEMGVMPEFGVIVWYESEDAARAAFKAVQFAHWQKNAEPTADVASAERATVGGEK